MDIALATLVVILTIVVLTAAILLVPRMRPGTALTCRIPGGVVLEARRWHPRPLPRCDGRGTAGGRRL